MTRAQPPLPEKHPSRFRVTVHGTVFGGREQLLARVRDGDAMRLVADPPGQDAPGVWVHLASGEPIGHLPPEIAAWLWPWMQAGGRVEASAVRVRGEDVPSWRRVVLEVACG